MKDKLEIKTGKKSVFLNNPYDIEVIFEALSVASDNNVELLFMDMLVDNLKNCKDCDITDISYNILKELKTNI